MEKDLDKEIKTDFYNESPKLSAEETEQLLEKNWVGERDKDGKRIESNKIVVKPSKLKHLARATVAGIVLGNTNPVIAESSDMIANNLVENEKIEKIENIEYINPIYKNTLEKSEPKIPFYETGHFRSIFERATPEQQDLIERLIIDLPSQEEFEASELIKANKLGLKDPRIESETLAMQQQIFDLQKAGEIAPKIKIKDGSKLSIGEYLKLISEKGQEFQDNTKREQDISIERATPTQIYHWIKWLKNRQNTPYWSLMKKSGEF